MNPFRRPGELAEARHSMPECLRESMAWQEAESAILEKSHDLGGSWLDRFTSYSESGLPVCRSSSSAN
jgi:hypothetical protein